MRKERTMKFEDYKDKFKCVALKRENGIIEISLNQDGGPLIWGKYEHAQSDIADALVTVSNDSDNRVVILTGTGDVFCGPMATKNQAPKGGPERWELLRANGMRMMNALLNMPGPVISCINGPAPRLSQLAIVGDIVLASENASVQDSPHFPVDIVPGDGVQLLYPLLMGTNRGRYFLLTGQTLDAKAMLDLGIVSEVLPLPDLLPRAWELARGMADKDPLMLRYTKMALNAQLKELLGRHMEHSLAIEGLAGLRISQRSTEWGD